MWISLCILVRQQVVKIGEKPGFEEDTNVSDFSSRVPGDLSTVDNQTIGPVGKPFSSRLIQISSTGFKNAKEVLSA